MESAPVTSRPTSRVQSLVIAAWLIVLVSGMVALWDYKLTPGERGSARAIWPSDATLAVSRDRPTLVLFAHPRCPCTRASLAILRTIVSRFGSALTTHVVFFRPGAGSTDWSNTDTWRDAQSLAGVRVVVDTGGEEAIRFGAKTSGHVVLYDRGGRLAFAGGITPGRGHVGGSPELEMLIARIAAAQRGQEFAGAVAVGAVYGCSLGGEK